MRIETLEDDVYDLKERFRRKENRENMRSARDEKAAKASVSQDALSILASATKPVVTDPDDRAVLYKLAGLN
jgi:hypothetical protein